VKQKLPKWKKLEYKRINLSWKTKTLGTLPLPPYEIAVSPTPADFRGSAKAEYFRTMKTLADKLQGKPPSQKEAETD
jgi:hypothetical protein